MMQSNEHKASDVSAEKTPRSIRFALEDDISRILEIENASISPPWTHGGLLGEIYNEESFFALAVENDITLGFIILRRIADDESELLQIAVDPAHRRKGAADMLLNAVLDWAKDQGINSVFLEVRKSNLPAIALYKKHGFTITGLRKDYYTGPVEDALTMTLAHKETHI